MRFADREQAIDTVCALCFHSWESGFGIGGHLNRKAAAQIIEALSSLPVVVDPATLARPRWVTEDCAQGAAPDPEAAPVPPERSNPVPPTGTERER